MSNTPNPTCSPTCQDFHERVKVMEVKQKLADKKTDEMYEMIKEIKTAVDKLVTNTSISDIETAKDIEAVRDRLEKVENNQKWWALTGISFLLQVLWTLLKKFIEKG